MNAIPFQFCVELLTWKLYPHGVYIHFRCVFYNNGCSIVYAYVNSFMGRIQEFFKAGWGGGGCC